VAVIVAFPAYAFLWMNPGPQSSPPARLTVGKLLQDEREAGTGMIKRFANQVVVLEGHCTSFAKNDDGFSIVLTGLDETNAVICRVASEPAPDLQAHLRSGAALLVSGKYSRPGTLVDCKVVRISKASAQRGLGR
jgi:hypothetical protein